MCATKPKKKARIINMNLTIVDNLIKGGTNINVRDMNGKTALMWASINGYKETVDNLIKKEANVDDFERGSGETVLIKASLMGKKEIVDSLIKAGANINTTDKYDETALMRASFNGHKEVVDNLIKGGAHINAVNKGGFTALMWASRNGHKEIMISLISADADINTADNDGWTALMSASSRGRRDIVDNLIKEGANIDTVNKHGNTALMEAFCGGNNMGSIYSLIEEGANPYVKNNYGKNTLDFSGDFRKYIIKKHKEYKKKRVEHLTAFLTKGGEKNGRYWDWNQKQQDESGLQKSKKCGPFPKDIAQYIARTRYEISDDEWVQMCQLESEQ